MGTGGTGPVDPVAELAVLLGAVARDAASRGDHQLWAGLTLVVHGPYGSQPGQLVEGAAELVALRQEPGDADRAAALASVLVIRTSKDLAFRERLDDWLIQDAVQAIRHTAQTDAAATSRPKTRLRKAAIYLGAALIMPVLAAVLATWASGELFGSTSAPSSHASPLPTRPASGSPASSRTVQTPGQPSHSSGLASSSAPDPGTAGLPPPIDTFADPGGGSQHVNSVAFSPNGQTLATGDMDGNTYLWNTATSQPPKVLAAPGGAKVFSVAFSPDGSLLATGTGNGSTYLWDTATASLVDTVPDPGGKAVNAVAFAPSGGLLATGDKNGHTYVWHVSVNGHTATATLSSTLSDPARSGIWDLAFSPDGTKLATGDFTGHTYLWNPQSPAALPSGPYTVPGGQFVTAVAFSADGTLLATGDYNGETYLWHLSTGSHSIFSELGTVWGVAFSGSGTLAIADDDGNTYLWDTATGQQTTTLPDPGTGSEGVGAVAFSASGTLATGDTNGSTYLWKVG